MYYTEREYFVEEGEVVVGRKKVRGRPDYPSDVKEAAETASDYIDGGIQAAETLAESGHPTAVAVGRAAQGVLLIGKAIVGIGIFAAMAANRWGPDVEWEAPVYGPGEVRKWLKVDGTESPEWRIVGSPTGVIEKAYECPCGECPACSIGTDAVGEPVVLPPGFKSSGPGAHP